MTNELTKHETRIAVLQLLTEREMAQVGDPLAACKLTAGEEYLDLEEPTAGVQRSRESSFPKGRVLPRRAVDAQTWQGILVLVQGDRT
jgi:hypothetical protein